MDTRMTDERAVFKRAQEQAPVGIGPRLGLTSREGERACIGNYVRAVVADDKHELGYFRELTEKVETAAGQRARAFGTYMPPAEATLRRDLSKASGASGGYLVETAGEGFAAALDAASLLGRLPVTRLPNMVGDVAITRESVKGTAGWLATEVAEAPSAESTFGQVALTPRTVAASVILSRQLVKQAGPGGNAFIERALATTVAEAADLALLNGSGALGQPIGILNVPGIDSRAGTSFALSDAAAMLKAADGWDASGSVRWVAGVDAAEDLRTRLKSANGGETLMADDGTLLGKPVLVSRSVGAQVLAVMPWSQLWVATWGAMEIGVDTFTHFTTGKIVVRCLWNIDFAPERAQSIAVATALT